MNRIMWCVPLGCCLVFGGYGCRSSMEQEQMGLILKKLDEINQNLVACRKAQEEYEIPKAFNSGERNMNKGRLLKIKKLSAKPSDDEIREYIRTIQQMTVGQNSYAPSDFQVELYKKIGPGHLKLLLPYFSSSSLDSYHLKYALPGLITMKDKDLILQNLRQYPGLLKAVIELGLLDDAKKDLFEMLKDSNSLWELQNAVTPLVRTKEDRDTVIHCFYENPNGYSLFSLIQTFPDVDSDAIANTGWKKRGKRYTGSRDWTQNEYARIAAQAGNVDALGFLIQASLNDRDHDGYGDQNFAKISILTGGIPKKDLLGWYEKNKDKLVFNKENRRFQIQK